MRQSAMWSLGQNMVAAGGAAQAFRDGYGEGVVDTSLAGESDEFNRAWCLGHNLAIAGALWSAFRSGARAGAGALRNRRRVVHWFGGVIHARGELLRGWPCCCSGEKCMRIAATGLGSTMPCDVTCKSCLRVMRKDYRATEWGVDS